MDIIEPGHIYALNYLDGSGQGILTFVKRQGLKYPGNVGQHQGTTSQEVLRALYNRAMYVNRQMRSIETSISIYLLALIIWLYEVRNARKKGNYWPSISASIKGKTCFKCGHVNCNE